MDSESAAKLPSQAGTNCGENQIPNQHTGMPVRILFTQKFAGLGGAQKSLIQLIEHLDRTKYEPHVMVVKEGWITTQLTALKVPWMVFPFGHWNFLSIPRNLLLVHRLWRYIRENRIALVHANEHWVAPPCWWAARLAGVPAICHFRTGLEDLTPHRVRKYLYARFDRVLAVAEVLRHEMAKHVAEPQRIMVVRDGVESPVATPQSPLPRNRCIIITVGAIRRFKGQRKVVEKALPWLKADRRRYLLLVGGIAEPDYGESVVAFIRQNHLERQVRVLGSRQDLPRLFEVADALVAWSSLEGVPRVVMEAMLAGRPVIVSNTPGMSEVVTEGEVGRIVDFEGSGEPLTQALNDLSENRARWQAMGRRAHEVAATRYSTRATAQAIQAIYQELLPQGASRGE